MPKVKICGITQPQQAREISLAGADYIGVVLYPKSPRYTDLEKVKEIKKAVVEPTKLVAVVVNPDLDLCKRLLELVDIIQFHGDEDLEFIKQFPKDRVIKAFRIKDEKDIEKLKPFIEEGYLILIDAYKDGEYGGTGNQVDLGLLKEVCSVSDKIIVAGGLSDENIGNILREINPFGVDASSKLEISPGIKDIDRVKRFIKVIKG
ncbi:MAG: phosphoribosylanthranilate isomerase [Hydrogenothermaceae bacterium]|nr:phosphoribosylanthranilate isomerase [Hydrogenothermaceae bacterium]